MKLFYLQINGVWDYFYTIFNVEISQWPIDTEYDIKTNEKECK
ncbi:hypothetical protein PTUN_b0700 [Pseudoalteromonas tunicata]|jgi:hypothetical protein|uniref:Uncharacterized protein n=1 Tax=Pseudoalteromonas tunicata D2 TaxID=87626 RepID=A4C4J2_9GAMM|nr:hypothetical protein PTUN_b0700 [Pseudoalteromonas tunicata]EAR30474.1 hypothetical protein PTD2_02856 [Pseudoalteromonas tunicata D2]